MSIAATMSDTRTAGSKMRSIVFASSVGTIIEWYDFLIYATAAALVFNKAFFPTIDPARRHVGGARHLCRGLSGASARRRAVRPLRRSPRTQVDAGADHVHHGAEHVLHRPASELRIDRRACADPSHPAAHRPGHRPWRRMGRRFADGDRALAARQARVLRQLRSDRISDRTGARNAGVCACDQTSRSRFPVLGLAHPLPCQHRSAGARHVHSIQGSRRRRCSRE